jgi:hypothetical protein
MFSKAKQYIELIKMYMSDKDMVRSLQALGCQVAMADDMQDVGDVFESVILNRQGDGLLLQIIFPSQQPTHLNTVNETCKLEIMKGGQYLVNDKITK